MSKIFRFKNISCPICGPEAGYKVVYSEQLTDANLKFVARKTPDHLHFRIVKCKSCGLIYSNPILDDNEILASYINSEFISEEQLNNMKNDYLKLIGRAISECQLVERKNFLEIGCANGFLLEKTKELYFENVYGVEPGRAAFISAAKDIKPFIVNDFFRKGLFQENYFDMICFFQVFDHVIYPNQFLHDVHSYLRQGGIVVAVHHNIKALMPLILGRMASTYDIQHIHLWDRSTMRRILQNNGFSVVKVVNISNTYQLDHVIRMLPLPSGFKNALRNFMKILGASDIKLRAPVENMLCVARKI